MDLKGRRTGTEAAADAPSALAPSEIHWRVILSETSLVGQAGVSSKVASSPRCPRKAKLREPQICLLYPSLRKDLRPWF